MIRRKRSDPISAERRQLEEIAHLYFPVADTSGGKAGDARENPPEEPSSERKNAPFLICCTAAGDAAGAAAGCLFNLGVLLKISDGPVLLLGSDDTYRERFSFQFRPDRERFFPWNSPAASGIIRGPMDIRLVEAGAVTGGRDAGLRDALIGGGMPCTGGVHYLLTDDLSAAALFQDLPGMVLFLVSPQTKQEDFGFLREGPMGRFCSRTGYAGVVTVGTGEESEEEELFQRWQEVLTPLFPGDVRVENMGSFPGSSGRGRTESGGGIGMQVLEAPGSPETRRLMEIAARIRKKRSARIPVPFPESGEGRVRHLLEQGVFRSAGLTPLSGEGQVSRRGPLLLMKKPEERVMIVEWVPKLEDVNMDLLLSRYLRVYEGLNGDTVRTGGGLPAPRFPTSTMLPGIVLVLEEKRDARRLEQALMLISRIPVEVYSLHRRTAEGGGEQIVLEPEDLELTETVRLSGSEVNQQPVP